MYSLRGIYHNKPFHLTFNSIECAYLYYLDHYATISERLYYIIHAHSFLGKVKDENCMKAIFRNVFSNAVLCKEKDA